MRHHFLGARRASSFFVSPLSSLCFPRPSGLFFLRPVGSLFPVTSSHKLPISISPEGRQRPLSFLDCTEGSSVFPSHFAPHLLSDYCPDPKRCGVSFANIPLFLRRWITGPSENTGTRRLSWKRVQLRHEKCSSFSKSCSSLQKVVGAFLRSLSDYCLDSRRYNVSFANRPFLIRRWIRCTGSYRLFQPGGINRHFYLGGV